MSVVFLQLSETTSNHGRFVCVSVFLHQNWCVCVRILYVWWSLLTIKSPYHHRLPIFPFDEGDIVQAKTLSPFPYFPNFSLYIIRLFDNVCCLFNGSSNCLLYIVHPFILQRALYSSQRNPSSCSMVLFSTHENCSSHRTPNFKFRNSLNRKVLALFFRIPSNNICNNYSR